MINHAVSQSLAIPSGLLVSAGISPAFVAKFSLFTGLLLMWTIAVGKVLKRFFGLPVIAGRIVAGILLGPSLINISSFSLFSQPIELYDQVTRQIYLLSCADMMLFIILLISAALTVSYLLWVAGHETDVKDIISIGPVAVMAGILGALLPIAMIGGFLHYFLGGEWDAVRSIGMGLIFAATSVSIPIAMLVSYNKMHLRSSKAALGAAVVDDIFAVILLALFSLGLQSGLFGSFEGGLLQTHTPSIMSSLFFMIVGFVVMGVFGYFIMRPLMEQLKKGPASDLIAPVAQIFMLFYFAFSEMVGGLAGITGAYFAGLFHRMGDHHHTAFKVITPFVDAFLLPLFLGSIGLQLNMSLLGLADWVLVIILLLIAIISKLAGCWLATTLHNMVSKKSQHTWTGIETYLFGSSMVARGEVGLVVSTILFGSGIISAQQYVIAVVVIVLTTVATPIMLAQGFMKLSATAVADTFSLNVGLFPTIGATHMFDIICDSLEESGLYHTTVEMSEGGKIVNIEGENVEIILNPNEGIFFKGDKHNSMRIITFIREGVKRDLESFGN